MSEIKLTQGKVALVDDDDFEWLNQWKWYLGKGNYATRDITNPLTKKREKVYMHRLLTKTPKKLYTDHINGDSLDNRKENLRIVTHHQNMKNMKMHKDNTSGYKGVSWHKKANKWESQIMISGKKKHLGLYKQAKIAALAYNIASIGYNGKFAHLNDLGGQSV